MARENIVELIRQRARPESVALMEGEGSRTYGDLLSASTDVAIAIRAQLGPVSDLRVRRVGVHHQSGGDYIALALGILEAGGCFVPIPEELAPAEKRELCERTSLDAVLCEPDFVAEWLPNGRPARIELGGIAFDWHRLDAGNSELPEADFASLNPAFVRFSSGTTGRSKGVVLSHTSLRERITAANTGLKIGPEDRVLWVLPMAHHFAVSIILYLYHGATTILSEGSVGGDLLDAAIGAEATVMYGSPFHFRQLAGSACDREWSSLRLAVSTAAALDSATASSFEYRFGRPLVQGFGIIEAGLPFLNLAAPSSQPESIGQLLDGYEARLRPLAPSPDKTVGELCLRGPGLFDAYLDPWQLRKTVVDDDGWFATGDLANCDSGGNWFVCGRLKSIINVGGMKVFAEEVERVLSEHPGVQRSLVSGQPHAVFGEVPVATYIPVDGPLRLGELKQHCRQHLSAFKVPLIFTAVEELPTTASGKLRRVDPCVSESTLPNGIASA